MLFVVEERLEGLKYNQESAPDTKYISRDGVGVHREKDMPTLCKNGTIQFPLIADISKTETHIFSSNLHLSFWNEWPKSSAQGSAVW